MVKKKGINTLLIILMIFLISGIWFIYDTGLIESSSISVAYSIWGLLTLSVLALLANISYYRATLNNIIIPYIIKFSALSITWCTGLYLNIVAGGIYQKTTMYIVLTINAILQLVVGLLIITISKKRILKDNSNKNILILMVITMAIVVTCVKVFMGISSYILETLMGVFSVITLFLYVYAAIILYNQLKQKVSYYIYMMQVSCIFNCISSVVQFYYIDNAYIVLCQFILSSMLEYSLPIIGICFSFLYQIRRLDGKMKQEVEFKTQLNKYYKIIDRIDSLILVFDNNYNMEYMNSYTRRLLGDRKDIDSLDIEINKMRSFKDIIKSSRNEIDNKYVPLRGIINLNNETKYYKGEAYTVVNEINTDKFYVISLKDETDNVILTKNLIEKERKFRNITNNISDLIIEIDTNEVIKYYSPSFIRMFGKYMIECVGLTIEQTVPSEISKSVKENINKAKLLKQNVVGEVSYYSKSYKRELCLEYVVSPIINTDITGFVVSARDISKRRAAEEKQREESKKLEDTLSYDKLRTEFFSNISHELRTPINVIFSVIQVIELHSRNNKKDGYHKYNKILKQNCFRLLRLINNLIDITKIDAGYMKLIVGRYDIVSESENIVQSVVPYAESRGLTLVFDTYEEELEVYCDMEKMERAILNLLSNAIKFTPSGGYIKVLISKKDNYAVIEVMDNGQGIPKNMLDIVFDRFRQVDKSFSRKNEGSGIGLSLVKSIVELHHGKLKLESEENKGSKFSLLIPIDENKNLYQGSIVNDTQQNNYSVNVEFSDIYDL